MFTKSSNKFRLLFKFSVWIFIFPLLWSCSEATTLTDKDAINFVVIALNGSFAGDMTDLEDFPYLKDLAGNGVVLNSYYTSATSSRASFLYGKPEASTPSVPLLTEKLQEAGYNLYGARSTGTERGFVPISNFAAAPIDATSSANKEGVQHGEEDVFMSLLLEADEATCDHPFFFLVSFENKENVKDWAVDTSLQANISGDTLQSSSFLSHVDTRAGFIIEHLKSSGSWGNTVFIMMSDIVDTEIDNQRTSQAQYPEQNDRAPAFISGGYMERYLEANTPSYQSNSLIHINVLNAIILGLASEALVTPLSEQKEFKAASRPYAPIRSEDNDVAYLHEGLVDHWLHLLANYQVSPCSNDATGQTDVLSILYLSTLGESWLTKSNWLMGEACPNGNWYGVKCNSSNISQLHLNENNLVGSLPSQLGMLVVSSFISLNTNSLNGPIPSQFGLWTSLTYGFDLDVNNFTGLIPSEMGMLTGLKLFDFYFNSLSGSIPSQLGLLASTTHFDIHTNLLSGPIPSQLGLLTELNAFWLTANRFCGDIPSEVSALSSLEGMKYDVSDNPGLGTACPSPSPTPLPTDVVLSQSDVLGLLYGSTLGTNWLTSTHWLEGDACPSSNGGWHGISCDGSNVVSLELDDNNLVSTIPSELGTLLSISLRFNMVGNSLNGSMPSELGRMSMLTGFYLSANSLTGSIPSQFGEMTGLNSYFRVNTNSLTGCIPSELGKLVALSSLLKLDTNHLTGEIPSELGAMTAMTTEFSLHFNNLTGSIPSELGQMRAMSDNFFLVSNALTNSIPSELGLMNAMTNNFKLYGNSLTGCIPSELGQMTAMVHDFNLLNNNLYGSIPSEVGLMSAMSFAFYLSFNNLSGAIPSEFGQMSLLAYELRLYSNSLSASLPSEFGQMTAMIRDFYLYSNSLSASLPSELGQMTGMSDNFDISSNLFCGEIPPEVEDMLLNVSHSSIGNNSFGTLCCITSPAVYTCSPTITPTPAPSITYRPTNSPTIPPTSVPTVFAPLSTVDILTIVSFGIGCLFCFYMSLLHLYQLKKWPSIFNIMAAVLSVTSIGTEIVFAAASATSHKYCYSMHSPLCDSGWVILSLNMLVCSPALIYRLNSLKLALDGEVTNKRSLLYSPVLLLTAIDGNLIVWLPWRETAATKALSGFPDLSSVAFTSWSMFCRKFPFFVFTFQVTFISNSDHSMLNIVTLIVTGLSLLQSLSQRLLRYLGYGSSEVDVVVGPRSNFYSGGSVMSGGSGYRNIQLMEENSYLEGGLQTPLVGGDAGGGGGDGYSSGRSVLSSYSGAAPYIAQSASTDTSSSLQAPIALLISICFIAVIMFGKHKIVLQVVGYVIGSVVALAVLYVGFSFVLKCLNHQVTRNSTVKNLESDLEEKERNIEAKERDIEANKKDLETKERDLEHHRKREDFIREYLRTQHNIEFDGMLPLDEVKEKLSQAFRCLMGDVDEGLKPDKSPQAEAEVMRWQNVLEAHPDLKLEKELEKVAWLNEQLPRCIEALELMRTFIPPNVKDVSFQSLVQLGLPLPVAKRISRTATFQLLVTHKEDIARKHVGDLNQYGANGLDIVELRAVVATLPDKMENDNSKGVKAAWLESFRTSLQPLVRDETSGNLPKNKLRHSCYDSLGSTKRGPFDPSLPLVKREVVQSTAFDSAAEMSAAELNLLSKNNTVEGGGSGVGHVKSMQTKLKQLQEQSTSGDNKSLSSFGNVGIKSAEISEDKKNTIEAALKARVHSNKLEAGENSVM